jgi:glutaredoxin
MVSQFLRYPTTLKSIAALITVTCLASPAQAHYKVVAPDGKVTYTDRPITNSDHKVQSINSRGGVVNDVALPYELSQTTQRFPVTLYTTDKCTPCDTARQLLRQRGVPFAEKTVKTQTDSEALQQQVGGRDLPSATIGSQVLRGLQHSTWHSYLDAAGYPKESRLPASFQNSAASPLTDIKESVNAPGEKLEPARKEVPPPVEPVSPTTRSFKF